MERAVVIGGAGFIGRWLSETLAGRGYRVIVVDLRPPPSDLSEWIRLDVGDSAAVAKVVSPGDLVVHLVHGSIPAETMNDPVAELTQNVIPYLSLLERWGEKNPPRLLVYSSTGGQIYGNAEIIPVPETALPRPLSPYAAAKLTMESFTRLATSRHGFPHLILRLGNPYGPYQELTNRHGVVPALFRSVLRNSPFPFYGGGGTVRDYIYIADAVEAIVRLVEGGVRNETVNIGSGRGTSLTELKELVEKVSGGKVSVKSEPLRPSDVMTNVLDIGLLKKLTGFSPRLSLEEGLRRTWDYLRKK